MALGRCSARSAPPVPRRLRTGPPRASTTVIKMKGKNDKTLFSRARDGHRRAESGDQEQDETRGKIGPHTFTARGPTRRCRRAGRRSRSAPRSAPGLRARRSSAHEVDPAHVRGRSSPTSRAACRAGTRRSTAPTEATPGTRRPRTRPLARVTATAGEAPALHVHRPPVHAGQGQGRRREARPRPSTRPTSRAGERTGASGAGPFSLQRARARGAGAAGPPTPAAGSVPPALARGLAAAVPSRAADPARCSPSAQIEIDDARRPRSTSFPGRPTEMWTYGGSFPGPTIRRPAGEADRGHLQPRSAGEGRRADRPPARRPQPLRRRRPARRPDRRAADVPLLRHLPPARPARLRQRPADRAGRRAHLHATTLIEDGGPERAAFQWYHDHRLDRTARNVWRGLAGMWIVDDDLDASLPLPRGDRDLPLMITDRSFKPDNQLTDPFGGLAPRRPTTASRAAACSSTARTSPTTASSARRHRLRVLNASNFRSYNLAALERRADDPDRDRERADAGAARAQAGPGRARRAGRARRRLRPLPAPRRRAA